jgi:hypothetical protein
MTSMSLGLDSVGVHWTEFHLGVSSRGGKHDNCRIKRGWGYSKCFFISEVLVNLGDLGPPGKFLFFQPPRLFLVASGTRLSVISTGSPPLIKYKIRNVSLPVRSAKLKVIYGLKLPIWALSYTCILHMWLVATLKGGANAPTAPPLNETLLNGPYMYRGFISVILS